MLVLTDTHREALSTLPVPGLRKMQKGITLLLGEAGMGKTMLQHALTLRRGRRLFVCLDHPTLNRRELLSFLAGSWS